MPLCRSHHRNLHQSSKEQRWWEDFRIEPLPIARKLWEATHPSASQVLSDRNVEEANRVALVPHGPGAAQERVEADGASPTPNYSQAATCDAAPDPALDRTKPIASASS